MKKLEMLVGTEWKPVFCHINGRPMTLSQSDRSKALPSVAWHGEADLKWFADNFGNDQFRLN